MKTNIVKIKLSIESKPDNVNSAIDVGDAIEKIFSSPQDKLIMSLDSLDVEIPLCYVFSDLLEDFLNIIRDVNSNTEGEGLYGFSQNKIFDCDWKVLWKDNFISIDIDWRYLSNDINIDQLPNQIRTNKIEFINQWKIIFKELLKYLNDIEFEYNDEYLELKKLIDS
ncbi:MAG: hypothetical protein JKY54_07740 [Flavobacteriales bacterium]|nr:hypothetical protein [Flavobacteriales bacterium]